MSGSEQTQAPVSPSREEQEVEAVDAYDGDDDDSDDDDAHFQIYQDPDNRSQMPPTAPPSPPPRFIHPYMYRLILPADHPDFDPMLHDPMRLPRELFDNLFDRENGGSNSESRPPRHFHLLLPVEHPLFTPFVHDTLLWPRRDVVEAQWEEERRRRDAAPRQLALDPPFEYHPQIRHDLEDQFRPRRLNRQLFPNPNAHAHAHAHPDPPVTPPPRRENTTTTTATTQQQQQRYLTLAEMVQRTREREERQQRGF
ncbi:hypothetical protein AA313_de0203310 [Arthrobotrys entomopaga]|nr:hypothetical protein AA313_de0203310 [Arthrobotrys entomopaga]